MKVKRGLLNGCMERNNGMPAVILSPRKTDIADYANQATARHENSETMRPNLGQFGEELFVVLNVAHLTFRVSIFY